MKGVEIKEDKVKKRRYAVIDLKSVKSDASWAEDLLDLLVFESRRDEKRIPWEQVEAKLRKEGRL